MHLSTEALFSLFLLCSVLLLPASFSSPSYSEVLLVQKGNDLLAVWMMQRSFSQREILSDIQLVFPMHAVLVEIDGSEYWHNKRNFAGMDATSSSIFFLDDSLQLKELRLTIYH
ncbi:MAG: hypothetical protein ABID38_01025 [Candidatus Diapherotrites archaeon]